MIILSGKALMNSFRILLTFPVIHIIQLDITFNDKYLAIIRNYVYF